MRRALLVAAVALPAAALAVTPGTGVVLDTSNYNTTNAVSYINAAQCSGTDKLHLEWNVSPLSGSTLLGTDVFKIYSSNKAPTSATTGGTWCAETTDSTAGTNAGLVASTTATTLLQSMDVSGSVAVGAQAANVPCTSETTPVYVCVHWYDGGTTRKGWAIGTFLIQALAPPAPTGLSNPLPGSDSLALSWSANPTSPTTTDHYVAYAFTAGTAPAAGTKPPFATVPAATVTTTGTSATLTGLAQGTTYDIIVVAYSIGGNPSGASSFVEGQPVPTAGFWQIYRDRGGVEQGGCSAGAAGGLSMLGAASLLALRRRKR